MIKMNAKVKFNKQDVLKRGEKATHAAQMQLDNDILKDSNYFIPKNTGNLEASGLTGSQIGKGLISWTAKYARKLYYNSQYKFSKDKNPNASGLWFEMAKARNKKNWLKDAKKAYRKHFGG